MYRTIIEIREDVPADVLKEMREACIKAHKNRGGEVKIKDVSERSFVFEGGEDKFGCMQLANFIVNSSSTFRESVKEWRWEDEEAPGENCDLYEILTKSTYIIT